MFRVMTFNIRFGQADDGPNSWPNRRELVASTIASARPDLVGLQEALDFQLAEIEPLLPEYRVDGNRGNEDGVWRNCCALLYRPERWTLLETHTFWLSETPNVSSRSWGSKWPRRCTAGRYLDRESGRELWHFNTHLDFGDVAQVNGAAVIWRKVLEWAEDSPVILTGDFNAPDGSRVWRILTGEEEHMGLRPDFRDAWSVIHDGERGPTCHGYGTVECPDRIDWILYSGCLDVVGSYVIAPPPGGPYPSDHSPVVAEMEWR